MKVYSQTLKQDKLKTTFLMVNVIELGKYEEKTFKISTEEDNYNNIDCFFIEMDGLEPKNEYLVHFKKSDELNSENNHIDGVHFESLHRTIELLNTGKMPFGNYQEVVDCIQNEINKIVNS